MSKIAIKGATTGTGVFTLESPATNTDRTLILPDEAGTVLTTAGVPASAMPAGSVIQVVQALKTDATSNASGNWADISGLSASITPTSASNKILVVMNLSASCTNGYTMFSRILRNGTAIGVGNASGSRTQANAAFYNYSGDVTYSTLLPLVSHVYDTPSTTSAITYKIQAYAYASTIAINYQLIGNDSAAYAPVVSSSITLMEIAG